MARPHPYLGHPYRGGEATATYAFEGGRETVRVLHSTPLGVFEEVWGLGVYREKVGRPPQDLIGRGTVR